MASNPGDTYNFILNIPDTGFTISSQPSMTVINLATLLPVTGYTAITMTFVTGTDYVYYMPFMVPSTSPADYVAIVSYATSAPATISNQFVSALHVGDSYITGPVALNATVAKDATVAKNATVLLASQYVAPGSDPTVQAINTNVQDILTDTTAIETAVGSLSMSSLAGLVQDIYDATFGTVRIDQTANPPVLYINRINGTNIATFQLINNPTTTERFVLTSPPESSV